MSVSICMSYIDFLAAAVGPFFACTSTQYDNVTQYKHSIEDNVHWFSLILREFEQL